MDAQGAIEACGTRAEGGPCVHRRSALGHACRGWAMDTWWAWMPGAVGIEARRMLKVGHRCIGAVEHRGTQNAWGWGTDTKRAATPLGERPVRGGSPRGHAAQRRRGNCYPDKNSFSEV